MLVRVWRRHLHAPAGSLSIGPLSGIFRSFPVSKRRNTRPGRQTARHSTPSGHPLAAPPPPFHLRSTLPRPTPPGGPCCCHSAFPSGKSEWLFLEADISAIPAGDALPHARLVNGRDQCKAGTMSCLLARRCSRRS